MPLLLSINAIGVRINDMIVRTRIAPSPTGENLHIGNAYTALINYIFAKKNNGRFIVRIEDTDRTRLVEGSQGRILDSLSWLGLNPDESPHTGGPYAPYRQSDRLDIYKKYAMDLVEKGHAYCCFCTPERLRDMRERQEKNHQPPMYDGTCKKITNYELRITNREKYVIRMDVPDEGVTTFHDLIRGDISFENKLIDDQVILKSDGYPTYHLGVVVDDHLMEISHIIRGEEWISSTPKHILLYDFFGWPKPVFAHMPLLRNPDKSKLSKRKNPVWVSWYRDQGYLPEALLNYLSTLAWSMPDGQDIFSLEEMMKNFRLENVKTTAPIFDIEKLKWMNKHYIMDFDHFIEKAAPFSRFKDDPRFERIAAKTEEYVKPRISHLAEYDHMIEFFFEKPKEYEKPVDREICSRLKKLLSDIPWIHEELEKTIRQLAEKSGMKPKDVFMQLRLAVTGKTVGLPLLESLEILGKEETLSRLNS